MEAGAGMSAEQPLRAVIIGAGNVASQLAPALEASGAVEVEAVWSRTDAHAEALCRRLKKAAPLTDLQALPADADFYLMSVADDALPRVIAQLRPNGALWAHTSGTVPAAALAGLTPHFGVFYPLQTISRDIAVDLGEAPFFIEGSTPEVTRRLTALARRLSPKVYEADSALRGKLHAAAVIACNFANHLWAIADGYLRREAGLDIRVLEPLMRETLRKALAAPPAEGQTGPARRGDESVMARHRSLLAPNEAELYKTLSDSIINYYKDK